MSDPVRMDVPHRLGAAEARRRIEAALADLAKKLPGGGNVGGGWTGNRLDFSATLMGQTLAGVIDVGHTVVHVELQLPFLLAMFAPKIEERIRRDGGTLLA